MDDHQSEYQHGEGGHSHGFLLFARPVVRFGRLDGLTCPIAGGEGIRSDLDIISDGSAGIGLEITLRGRTFRTARSHAGRFYVQATNMVGRRRPTGDDWPERPDVGSSFLVAP
jgi:hypothetical protein